MEYIRADYDFTYGTGQFWNDFSNLVIHEFLNNLKNLQGSYSNVLSQRDEYLNKPADKYNAEIQKAGKKLCTPRQIEQFVARKLEKDLELYKNRKENANVEYLDWLERRKNGN